MSLWQTPLVVTDRTPHMRFHVPVARILAVSVIATLAACGGGDSPTEPVDQTPVEAATVQATPSERFTPGRVNLLVGGTVTFAFGSLAHDVFFDNAPAGAPANITEPSANKSTTLTFTTPGTFVYNCHIHPGMTGTVIVE
jgi:plastocyanin